MQGLIQEQVYTQIFLNCHLAAFFAWNLKLKKQPNDNLKRFVCILAGLLQKAALWPMAYGLVALGFLLFFL